MDAVRADGISALRAGNARPYEFDHTSGGERRGDQWSPALAPPSGGAGAQRLRGTYTNPAAPPLRCLSGEASRCGGDGVRRSARTPDHGEQKRPAISVAGTQYSPSLHFRCQPDIGILHRGKIGKMRPALVVFQ